MVNLEDLKKKFWSKVNIQSEDDCWEWQGYTSEKGYGFLWIRGKNKRAHRISWIIYHHKEIPEGMLICHHCDNPSCVNPKHLFLGTPSDNVQDMMKKGRNNPNPPKKLNWKKVRNIRKYHKERTYTLNQMAKMYNVCEKTIQAVVYNYNWKE